MSSFNTQLKTDHALYVRLIVGLVFGLGIAFLIELTPMGRPVDTPLWASIALSTLMLGAFILWAGAGVMRRVSLAVWGAVALGLIAFMAWHRISHETHAAGFNPFFFNLSFLIYPFLFISHELIASADQSGKWIAPYPVYNDEAWHRGVQLVLAVIFTALFWGILLLGSVLLNFIGFKWFGELLLKAWVGWPLSGLALGAAVHLGDSQPKLINGVRALVLGILSWLLPVLTAIGLLFAVSLCFSGLEPLWKTKAACMTLLAACVGLTLLINAAYQQGDVERKVHIVLKWSARVASVLLLVFAGLALYGLSLRIQQYGLTPERVLALLAAIVASLFGLGYVAAAIWPKGRWLVLIEGVNVVMAVVMALLFLAVLTPVADPNRLSVDSQAARLQSGKVTVTAFDWDLLRFQTGTYGAAALKTLAKSGKTDAIRLAAAKAATKTESDRWDETEPPMANIKPDPKRFSVVFPQGGAIPADFWAAEFNPHNVLPCLAARSETDTCVVAVVDLDRDGRMDLLALSGATLWPIVRDKTEWRQLSPRHLQDQQVADFKAGKIVLERPAFDDVKIGDAKPVHVRDVRDW